MHQKSGNTEVQFWFLMTLGVIALVGIAAITVVRLLPGDADADALPPPPPPFTLPGGTTGPQVPVSLLPTTVLPNSDVPTTTGPAAPESIPAESRGWQTVPPPAATTTAAPTAAPASKVTGRYQVLQSFGDSFIGEVLLTNATGAAQDWRATLTFPANVGDLRTSWLESLPQARLSQSGRTFTWTSSVPLAARSTAQLRFNFERTGSGDTPKSCAVNGAPCR